jgi:hypothetical protein
MTGNDLIADIIGGKLQPQYITIHADSRGYGHEQIPDLFHALTRG